VRFDDTSRHLYATDASHYQIRPLGVVVPRTEDDLAVTVQIAAELACRSPPAAAAPACPASRSARAW